MPGEQFGQHRQDIVAPDLALDVDSHPQTCFNSIANLRKRGRHVQVGLMLADHAAPAIPIAQVIANELETVSSHGMQAHRYETMLEMILAGKLSPQRLVGRRVNLEESIAALIAMDRFEGTGVTVVDRFRATLSNCSPDLALSGCDTMFAAVGGEKHHQTGRAKLLRKPRLNTRLRTDDRTDG